MSQAPLFGPQWLDDRTVKFRLWAPTAAAGVGLSLDGAAAQPMTPLADGWYELDRTANVGSRYAFVIGAADGGEGLRVPDPAARQQAAGVHGDSLLVPPADAYAWRNTDWIGRPWNETVLYELHAGVHGGYAGVQARLPELAALGITAIELMPIAEAPGQRNWGYDGTLHYCPSSAYGSPDALRELIDSAHGLGMMVFLDVVYNHFGPDGNYLHAYAKRFFRSDIQTPWGDAIDFREPMVRAFFTENALYWLKEFRFDGLRFDAVHAISEADWLDEMAAQIRRETGSIGLHAARAEPWRTSASRVARHVHLVLEHDGNVASHLRGDFDAQWNDDSHHLLHLLLTDEQQGYYADYADRPADKFARWLSSGFIYQGEPSPHRGGEPRGEPSSDLSPLAFVNFLQNHDQIGNRPLGERLTTLCGTPALQAAAALLLLCPQIPLLFDGEELGCESPFLYFTDHNPELAEAVRIGRRKEFAMFAASAAIPDPNERATFDASCPASNAGSEQWREFYRTLIALRREAIVPRIHGAVANGAQVLGDRAVRASWQLDDGSCLTLYCNLDAQAITLAVPVSGELLFAYPESAGDSIAQRRLDGAATLAYIEACPFAV